MELMSTKQVAELFGVDETTIRDNAAKGTLGFRAIRIGGLWKFPKKEVMKHLLGE